MSTCTRLTGMSMNYEVGKSLTEEGTLYEVGKKLTEISMKWVEV